jgi:hypothetical protein
MIELLPPPSSLGLTHYTESMFQDWAADVWSTPPIPINPIKGFAHYDCAQAVTALHHSILADYHRQLEAQQ